MIPRIAITTTTKNPGLILETFIKYHSFVGFDHFIIFFDNPNDDSIDIVNNDERITIIRNNSTLKKYWKQTHMYKIHHKEKNFKLNYENELIGKQLLNISVAIELAQKKNIDWLLHIDVDELFYCPYISVKDHFILLDGNQIDSVSYINHEAVPESFATQDYFKEVTLFKKNMNTFSKTQMQFLSSFNFFIDNRTYFNYYGNGKSAARVNKNLLPAGPHSFIGQSPYNLMYSPCILHYPVCGYNFFSEKYKILGNFSDYWFGTVEIASVLPFHIKARNILSNKDQALAENYFRKHVMLNDLNLSILLDNEILVRIPDAAELINTL